jgi:hypothetical protein
MVGTLTALGLLTVDYGRCFCVSMIVNYFSVAIGAIWGETIRQPVCCAD